MADLDAENIYQIILQGYSSVSAFLQYYSSLSSCNNRSHIFKNHISYEDVCNKVFYELIDAQLLNIMNNYSNQGDIIMVRYYSNLLNNEDYHWNTINNQYHDTYNFLKSLHDNRSNIVNY